MAELEEVVNLHKNLKAEWSKQSPNLSTCGKLLNELKVALTKLMFLPTSNTTASQKELLIARDTLEIGAHWSIATKNIPSFERYMAQLKCYYLDYKKAAADNLKFLRKCWDTYLEDKDEMAYMTNLANRCNLPKDQLPESSFKYELLGLNLLHLLSQNRVAEFHTELELLPSDQIQSNIYIQHPLSLEQYLMEGNYNKIFLAKGNVPAKNYNFFIDILLDTIRNEIAGCMEVAYQKISASDADRMLNISNQAALRDYAAKKNWSLGPNNYFHFAQIDKKKSDEALPSKELVMQTMEYARELEMIV